MSTTSTNPTGASKTTSVDWNRASTSYTKTLNTLAQNVMHPPMNRLIQHLDSSSSLSTATAILDIGCGPGQAIAHLITTFSSSISADTQILASDFSSGMVLATTNLRTAKLQELAKDTPERDLWVKMTPLVLDAMDLSPLPDSSISHALANFVLFMVPDSDKALSEACRVLKRDGVLAASSWTSDIRWISYMKEAGDLVYSSLGRETLPKLLKMDERWQSTQGTSTLFARAGFRDVEAEYVETAMLVEDVDVWAKSFVRSGNPAVTWVTDGLDEEGLVLLEEKFASVLKEKCEVDDKGVYRVPGTAVVTSGRK